MTPTEPVWVVLTVHVRRTLADAPPGDVPDTPAAAAAAPAAAAPILWTVARRMVLAGCRCGSAAEPRTVARSDYLPGPHDHAGDGALWIEYAHDDGCPAMPDGADMAVSPVAVSG